MTSRRTAASEGRLLAAGVEAVTRKFVRCNIVPKVTSRRAFGQQVPDEPTELLCPDDVFTSVEECRKFCVVMCLGNEREGLWHSHELLASVTSLVPNYGETLEVAVYLALVPGN